MTCRTHRDAENVSIFRRQAMRTSFFGLPAATSRGWKTLIIGLRHRCDRRAGELDARDKYVRCVTPDHPLIPVVIPNLVLPSIGCGPKVSTTLPSLASYACEPLGRVTSAVRHRCHDRVPSPCARGCCLPGPAAAGKRMRRRTSAYRRCSCVRAPSPRSPSSVTTRGGRRFVSGSETSSGQ